MARRGWRMADHSDDKQAAISRTLQLGRRRRGLSAWFWASLSVVACVLALWGLVRWTDRKAEPQYRTETVSRGDLVVRVSATGTLEPTNTVDISSELSGTIRAVHVDFNDRVAVGQALASLDTTKLEAQKAVAEANVTAAIARLRRAETSLAEQRDSYDNAVALEQRGVTSPQALLTRRAAFYRAQADLSVAEAELNVARANLKLVKADLDKGCICAPINGIVLDRTASVGQIVASSLSAPVLFTIAEDLTQMEAQVAIDEADIGLVSEGDAAVFTVDAFDRRSFPATIRMIRYASEPLDGVVSYVAVLSVDNKDLSLRPGMTATADIIVEERAGVLSVPNAALRYAPPATSEERAGGGLLGLIMPERPAPRQDDGSGPAVWVLRAGAAVEVPVTIGSSDGRMTEITGGDLAEGEAVITGQAG